MVKYYSRLERNGDILSIAKLSNIGWRLDWEKGETITSYSLDFVHEINMKSISKGKYYELRNKFDGNKK